MTWAETAYATFAAEREGWSLSPFGISSLDLGDTHQLSLSLSFSLLIVVLSSWTLEMDSLSQVLLWAMNKSLGLPQVVQLSLWPSLLSCSVTWWHVWEALASRSFRETVSHSSFLLDYQPHLEVYSSLYISLLHYHTLDLKEKMTQDFSDQHVCLLVVWFLFFPLVWKLFSDGQSRQKAKQNKTHP